MRARIRARATLLVEFMSLTAGLCCCAAHGQQPHLSFGGHPNVGTTVSVASLRIPEKAWRHFEKAKTLAEHNRIAEADAESQKAIAIAPDFAAAYLQRASAQVREGNFEAAVASVSQACRIEPDALWTGVLLAGAFNGLHRYDEAAAILDELRGPEAESWQAAYEHARASIGLQDTQAALRWSAIALAGAPGRFTDAVLVRANSFILAQRWEEAASQMEAYLQTSAPQLHRAEALMALPELKRRAREEQLQQMASR